MFLGLTTFTDRIFLYTFVGRLSITIRTRLESSGRHQVFEDGFSFV